MNSILFYFLKSGIAMALFYGVYRIFMEKETNYSLNRYYLLGTMILSLKGFIQLPGYQICFEDGGRCFRF